MNKLSLTIYEISAEMRNLAEQGLMLDEADPDVVGEWIAQFDNLKDLREKKFESIAHIRNSMLSDAHAIDQEITRLAELKATKQALAKRMEFLMKQAMIIFNQREVETPLFKAKFVKNPAKLILTDEYKAELESTLDMIKEEMTKERVKVSEKKAKVKEELKSGKEVKGAHLEQIERLKIT